MRSHVTKDHKEMKRLRALQLSTQLMAFYKRSIMDYTNTFRSYTFHAPGKIYHFTGNSNIREKAVQIARSQL